MQRAYLHTKWHPNPSNRLATILQRHRQTDRQTDRTDKEPIANKDVLSQSPNLHICITSSLFNLLVPVAVHLSLHSRSAADISLRITDRSFRYASPCIWNQRPTSIRQPRSSPSVAVLHVPAPITSSRYVDWPLSSSVTPYNSCYYALPVMQSIDREFGFYEFFSFLKFNEFYDFFFGWKKFVKNS